MLGNRLASGGLLTIIISTTFSFSQILVEIKNVITDNPGCSETTYTSQTACEAAATCSNDQYSTQATCEAASDAPTWSPKWHTGTLDIYMTNASSCTYCEGVGVHTESLCEGSGGIWHEGDATIVDAETCSGVCDNPNGDVSEFQNQDPCEEINIDNKNGLCDNELIPTQSVCEVQGICTNTSFNNDQSGCEGEGTCSDATLTDKTACEDASATWTSAGNTWESTATWQDNTWTASPKDGIWFAGAVGGLQFTMTGIKITGVSGGSAETAGFYINTSDSMVVGALVATTIPTSDMASTLTQLTFTDFDGVGICFGEDTGSTGNTLISDGNNVYVFSDWGDCYCASQSADACGECGDNTSCMADGAACESANQCESDSCDCFGVCGGSGVLDNCNTCDGNPANDCDQDCAGTWGGTASDSDNDGVCDGDDDCLETPAGATDVDETGCTPDQLSISQVGSYLPNEFAISQNFPNPFNPVTNITFDVAQLDEISLVVYDLTGKEIATLVSGTYAPGRYQVDWQAVNNAGDGISSGMYIYRYISSEKAITRKMLYLK